jgi:hypothetical protein
MFAKDANTLWPQEPMTLLVIVDTSGPPQSNRSGQQTESAFSKRSSKNDSFELSWCILGHSIFNILDISHDLCTYYRTIFIYTRNTLPGWLQQLLSKLASKSSQ